MLSLEKHKNSPVLVFEDCGGQSILTWVARNPPLSQRVEVAIKARVIHSARKKQLPALCSYCASAGRNPRTRRDSQRRARSAQARLSRIALAAFVDINTNNVVYNETTGQLQVIDFGISIFLSRESPKVKNPNVLEGTLQFISPEQTGRMNRFADRECFWCSRVLADHLIGEQICELAAPRKAHRLSP